MSTSIFELQRDVFIQTIRRTAGNDWKVLVVDLESRKLLNNVTKEDDVLNANITNIEQIEEQRQPQPDTDAIYLLSPQAHIVECLKADLARKRYRRAFLIWTSVLPRPLEGDLLRSESRQQQIANSKSLDIEFFPTESNVVTFREPWSFHVLFNPTCDALVKTHLDRLTQRIVSVCVSLGENPIVKFYRPKNPRHDAAVLCSHLASFVQRALDEHAADPRNGFPPESQRPRATLIITDRTMDLMSPLVHELTYQAMAMDLLSTETINDKVTYRLIHKRGEPDQEERVAELTDDDQIWVQNRHLHMKDLAIKLGDDFKKFKARNKDFASADEDNDNHVTVNTIKNMLAGLPEYQEGKAAYSLHLEMAEKCAKIFQDNKLMDITSVEQSLATGLDEDNRKPKNLADQLVRLLDDDSVNWENRVRLLLMYVINRDGVLAGDIEKLRCHGQLSPMDGETIYNLRPLGAKVQKNLQEVRQPQPPQEPLFPPKMTNYEPGEEVSLSRFEPILKRVLEAECDRILDNRTFPTVKQNQDNTGPPPGASQTSLRSGTHPTWAVKGRSASSKPKQRLIIFMAGGATYSEARACYEVSQQMQREVYLTTSHMLTPQMFLRQVQELSAKRQQLKLPIDRAPPQMPDWMREAPPQASQPAQQPPPNTRTARPPINSVPSTTHDSRQGGSEPAGRNPISTRPQGPSAPVQASPQSDKDADKSKKEKKEKKHLNIFKRHH